MFSSQNHSARASALAITLSFLAACGGGSSGKETGSAPSASPAPGTGQQLPVGGLPGSLPDTTASPTPAPSPTPSPSPVPVQPGSIYPAHGDPVIGSMGETAQWSLVPLHVAITTDGRLLSYGRDPDFANEMIYDIWDPKLGIGADAHLVLTSKVSTDLFCSNQMLLTNGEMLITGGDHRINSGPGNVGNQTNRGNSDANVFNDKTNEITKRGQMNEPRWYGTLTMLPWGEVFIQGGAEDVNNNIPALHTEIASEDGSTYRQVTGFRVDDLPWYYPRNFSTSSGDIIGFAHNYTYRLDPRGTGTRHDTGHVPQLELNNGSVAVMYRPGKVLIGGGGNPNMMSVDITGAAPSYTVVPPMSSQRLWGMATVLPNGQVMVGNGGTSDTSISGAPLGVPAKHIEIYNPDTNRWTIGPSSQYARLYHSVTLLLPDATVLIGGGGLPGPVTNMNAEIWYPPYLFRADGSLATRPVIDQAPTVVNPSDTFSVVSTNAADIGSIAFVKTGAATHSYDQNQRYVPLNFTRSGNTLTVSLPREPGDTPPGFYHLFLLDRNGVPSISHIVRMNKYTGVLPASPAIGTETVRVGGTEGLRRDLGCAANEVLTGLHGRAYDRVYRLGPICTPIDRTTGLWNGASSERATSGDEYVDPALPNGGVFDINCPSDHAIAGFSGAASANGRFVGRIEASCRQLTAGGAVIGTPVSAPVIGTEAATATASCPNNKPATGITGQADYNAFYQFGLRCGG